MADIVIRKRHSIRKDEVAEVMEKLRSQIGEGAELFRTDRMEKVETDSPFTLYLVNRQPLLMRYQTWVFPTLKGALERPFPQRRVTIDQGAIPFLVNGADVMRPGIRSVTDDIKSDTPVLIAEELHGKPIAVAVSLYDAEQIRLETKGKMCKTIHFVGDLLWRLEV
ncbi:MAG: RNA-binding protein [Methanomicrobiales archaeon]|nr:RNA-binding protein [Methanomicrobiales archaeon]